METFPFLSLPIELRLKIYSLILPSRTHKIVTQYPCNSDYYTTSNIISHLTQTPYPAEFSLTTSKGGSSSSPNTAAYRLLNANFRPDFPSPSICPEILRTCKQIKEEAEPLLYGRGSVFEFGIHIDAIIPFLKDRSTLGRSSIRSIRIAREIPLLATNSLVNGDYIETADPLWNKTCIFLMDECTDLRAIDLTVWGSGTGMKKTILRTATRTLLATEDVGTGLANVSAWNGGTDEKCLGISEQGNLWHEWEWTRKLLKLPSLRDLRVAWWVIPNGLATPSRLDSGLGQRMVADNMVRDRMVHEGIVVERLLVLPGAWRAS